MKIRKKDNQELNITEIERFDPTTASGLSEEQVQSRVQNGLTNHVGEGNGNTILKIVIRNLCTVFNAIYFIIAIYLIIQKSWSNLTFLFVIIPNIAIGLFQEIKAKKTIDKLSVVNAPKATVIRDGMEQTIDTKDVVLDDIVVYKTGDQIYTDSCIISGLVEANEALLTGEADSIVKAEEATLLAGSYIVSGSCFAKAIRVGKDNYIEKVSGKVKEHSAPKSELLRTLNVIIQTVGILIPIMLFVTYRAGWSNLAICSVVLAMIPAGLFLLTSIALFVGEVNLAKKNTLVQELYCIEMLARVNCLCLDKTGTITDGTLKVVDFTEYKKSNNYELREIVGSYLNSFEEKNVTSLALEAYFEKNNIFRAKNVVPFSSKRKLSAVTFIAPGTKNGSMGTFFLGAPEFVLKDNFDKVKEQIRKYALEGYRVIALGFHKQNYTIDQEVPSDVTPVALIALEDHIRDDAHDTIRYFIDNDVEIRVISGDNPETVSQIAQRAGVPNADMYISLDGLSDEEVADIATDYYVFGRVSPEQKQILVRSLQLNGKTVAMTGDGVNDILALRTADCSIAMASGAEAARYSSHLVLLDSNFSSLPSVVREGRRVINNIQRTSSLFLLKTFFSISLVLIYLLLHLFTKNTFEYPFKEPSVMILIEMLAIGLPSTILALQPSNEVIKGKFIVNVLHTILPAVLTIITLHLVLYFVAPIFSLSNSLYSTIAVIMTNVVCLFVLYKVSKPFTWWKTVMFASISVVTFTFYILSMVNETVQSFVHAVSIVTEERQIVLLLLVFLLLSYYIYVLIKKIISLIKR